MKILDKILHGHGDSEECDTFDHSYGPWDNISRECRLRTTPDGWQVKVGITLRRECFDCGKIDRQWHPSMLEIDVETNEYHGDLRGSKCKAGLPRIENVEVSTE